MHFQGLPSGHRSKKIVLLLTGVLVVLLVSGCIDPMEPVEEETPDNGSGEDNASQGEKNASSGNGTTSPDEEDAGGEEGADAGDEEDGAEDGDGDGDENETGGPGDGSEDDESTNEDDPGDDGNDDDEEDPADEDDGPQWPEADEATLRPGVRVYTGETIQTVEMHCTTNFLYRSSDGTLHLGTAASCMSEYEIGDPVPIRDLETHGTLAYSGWWDGTGHDRSNGHDFALIALDEDQAGWTHPAVFHYGGPVGVGDLAGLTARDPVAWYGNTTVSPEGIGEGDEGYLCNITGQAAYVHPTGPVTSFDTGAGVLDGDGGALGILGGPTIEDDTCGASIRIEPLQGSLEEARSRGMDVELVPWTPLQGGLLPSVPP